MIGSSRLPEPFRALEPYLEWSLASEVERSAKRQASAYAEIQSFYDAMMERMEEILPYLEQFSPGDAPADAERLFLLTLSLAEVAPAVEYFGQASVVDGFDASRFVPIEIFRDDPPDSGPQRG